MAQTERVICRLDQLVESGLAMRFEAALALPARTAPCFAVAYKGVVHAYVNACPHRGTELDWQPGEVFEETGLYLTCATHGAIFEPDSGLCIAGPCHGAYLQSVPVKVVGNDVMLLSSGVEMTSGKHET